MDAIKVRPVGAAAHDGPAAELVAYGRSQLALGSVGLALESFRKALRQQPDDAEALRGLGDAYETMGKQELARRYYEQALALAPQDPKLLEAVGAVTEVPGPATTPRPMEVAQTSALLAALRPSPLATNATTAPSAPVASASRGPKLSEIIPRAESAAPTTLHSSPSVGSITVKLPPVRPFHGATQSAQAPRLERLSMGEVALVTTGKAVWQALTAPRSLERTLASMAPRRSIKVNVPIRLLNAARHQGLAARTRKELATHGWHGLQIGDAKSVHAKSAILYPAGSERVARSLAAKLDVRTMSVARGGVIIVFLGRDSARVAARQARA